MVLGGILYGQKKLPFHYKKFGTKISFEEIDNNNFLYTRENENDSIQKTLLSKVRNVYICPVEPVNLPKEICHNFLIEFEKNVFLNAGMKQKIYLNFPIEIGVFLKNKSNYELIDVFSYNSPKYSLYGDPHSGILCRYYKSPVYHKKSQTDIYKEGILTLNLENSYSESVEINKVLFNALGMKIYFNENSVEMNAKIKIADKTMAETEFVSDVSQKDKQKAIELFATRRLAITTSKAVMMEGLI